MKIYPRPIHIDLLGFTENPLGNLTTIATPRFGWKMFFFSARFTRTERKQPQWTAFLRKQDILDIAPNQFKEVVIGLHTFFRPMIESQIGNTAFESNWEPGGPWR